MATYKLPSTPGVTVSVRGKDSLNTRLKAVDKITGMLASGELNADTHLSLNAEDLILDEAPATTLSSQDDETHEPLDLALRELQKFLLLKIKTQKLKQAVVQIRAQIETVLTSDSIQQELCLLEEDIKSSFKTVKEYMSLVKDCRLAKPKAEIALSLLDEALQFKLSASTARLNTNQLEIKTHVFADDAVVNPATNESDAEHINFVSSNGYHA